MNNVRYGVADKPPVKELIPLSFQMLLSCFGATILVIGIGGLALNFAINSTINFSLSAIALATVVGIILNLVLPEDK